MEEANPKRFVTTASMVRAWRTCVHELLFPPHLIERLAPVETLERLGDTVPDLSMRHRDAVDDLISRIRSSPEASPADRWLMTADPLIVALYYDRIRTSDMLLQQLAADEPFVDRPRTDDIIGFLLFHGRPQ